MTYKEPLSTDDEKIEILHKISSDEAVERVLDDETAFENQLYDGVVTKEDARIIQRSIYAVYGILEGNKLVTPAVRY